MSICSRCGNSIDFRYVNGRCIPIHSEGGCIHPGNSKVFDYSGYTISSESNCFCTSCPVCKGEVYFIRHNGGSVWIDPPLGPPWFKHACFEPDASVQNALFSIGEGQFSPVGDEIIGVVKACNVDGLKIYTNITIETGRSKSINLRIKNNAGFLLGKLCVYEPAFGRIWPLDEPSYVFGTDKWVNRKMKVLAKKDLVVCLKCKKKVKEQDLKRHMIKVHGYF